MVKYTIDYCKENEIFITTPTEKIFKQTTKILKCSSVLKDSFWKDYSVDTCVAKDYLKSGPCYGSSKGSIKKDKIISYEIFFRDNNINFDKIYELW